MSTDGSGKPSTDRTSGGSGKPSPVLDPQLLEVLACPAPDHASLTYDPEAQTLTCTSCGRVYPVRDGLPVLLLDEVI
jgi:uncharacterized protein YbaR (Trm112 family)